MDRPKKEPAHDAWSMCRFEESNPREGRWWRRLNPYFSRWAPRMTAMGFPSRGYARHGQRRIPGSISVGKKRPPLHVPRSQVGLNYSLVSVSVKTGAEGRRGERSEGKCLQLTRRTLLS